MGDYNDFTVQWYFNIGASICLTLSLNIITPHISYLMHPIMGCMKKCCDRGCSSTIKKRPENPANDEVNTKLLLQSELQELYTNPQIASFYVYAQLFTTLWSCLCFSAGLPILYPVACLSFLILYWVYKVLLVKYYAKTTQFDEDLPLKTVSFMKYAIIFHMVVAAFMFTNSAIFDEATDLKIIDQFNQYVQEIGFADWFE